MQHVLDVMSPTAGPSSYLLSLSLSWSWSLTHATDYSEEMIMRRYRKELAGQLGNLVMRSTSSTLNPAAVAPVKPAGTINPADQSLHEKLVQLPGKAKKK